MANLKILQLSDVHLDCAFSGVLDQNVRNQLRGEQRDGFRMALAYAREKTVDMVLIPGDLFEHDRVDYDTIRFIQKELAALTPVPIFIAPGNHDPCIRQSYYLTLTWPDNVKIFTSPTFEAVTALDGHVTIFGIANSGAEDTRRPLAGFHADGHGWKIGLMHGSCTDAIPPRFAGVQCLPFSSDEIEQSGFDYVAVGHYHSFNKIPANGSAKACYSGCLRNSGFDETGNKCSICVEISETGISIEQIPSICRAFEPISLDIGQVETSEQVVDAVKQLAETRNLNQAIARVRLSGEAVPGLDLRSEEIRQRVTDSFFYLDLDISGISTAYDFDALAAQDTVAGRFVQEIRQKLNIVPPDSKERRVLNRAMLYALDALSGREIRQG